MLAGILVAAWGKSAQLPFHFWLPDAMEAPTPISAYLHAASMVKVGVYIFARTLLVGGTRAARRSAVAGAVMAIITLVYGFVMYFPQRDMKRLLAYSTITQLSYIFLALSLSVFGSTARLQRRRGPHLQPCVLQGPVLPGRRRPELHHRHAACCPRCAACSSDVAVIGISFASRSLAVTGVPPFNGFFSKFTIFAGGFQAAHVSLFLLPLVLVAMFESVGSFRLVS